MKRINDFFYFREFVIKTLLFIHFEQSERDRLYVVYVACGLAHPRDPNGQNLLFDRKFQINMHKTKKINNWEANVNNYKIKCDVIN